MDREREVEPDKPDGPVHYQSVQGGEVRNHGIGYYAFSTDVEKRKEQMELLNNLRDKVSSLTPMFAWENVRLSSNMSSASTSPNWFKFVNYNYS